MIVARSWPRWRLVIWLVKADMASKEFLAEVRAEMRKVTFPARDEVVATTIVVLITSLVFAVYLFVADRLIVWGYQGHRARWLG